MNYIISTDSKGNVHKWYYLLNGHTNANGKYIRGLLDDFPNIENKLIICSQPKEKERYFSLFESHLDFIEYNSLLPSENRHFYEVIFGQFPQKPHFDLDFDVDETGIFTLPDGSKIDPERILETLIQKIISLLQKHNIILNLETDILIYTSHGTNKRSYHLLVNNYYHSNNIEAKGFYEQVISDIPSNITVSKCIDPSVYSVKQQMRAIFSTKPGKNRYKILQWNFKVNDILYTHKLSITLDSKNPKYEKLLNLYVMEESFVSNTCSCKSLPSFAPQREVIKYTGNGITLNNEIVKLCMLFFQRYINVANIYNFFDVLKINNGLIILKIKNPYMCPICKRTHESENPYLSINIFSALSYYCRRAGSNLLLGYIEHEFMKENTLDLKLTGPIEQKIELLDIEVGLTPVKKVSEPNENTSTKVQWNTNVLQSLKEVQELTVQQKPTKIKLINDEVTDLFENLTETETKKEDTNEVDDLW